MSIDGRSSPVQTIPVTRNTESKEERSYDDPSKVRSNILSLAREISVLTRTTADVGKTAPNHIAVVETAVLHNGFICSTLIPSDPLRSQS